MTYQKTTGCLSQGAHPGSYNGQDAYNDMLIVEQPERERERESMGHDNGTQFCADPESKSCNQGERLQGSEHSLRESERYVARRLTPTECARLQGFPPDWCADVPHSDSQEYRLWGNGIALPCLLPMMVAMREKLEEVTE